MPLPIEKLKSTDEEYLFVTISAIREAIIGFLKNNTNAYTSKEIMDALNAKNTDQMVKKGKQTINNTLARIMKLGTYNIKKKGSYFYYEEDKK